MAKLRKMLGDINGPVIKSLMVLIETQSAATLAKWAVGYAEQYMLDIYRKAYPDEVKVAQAISVTREYLDGTKTVKEVKAQVKAINQTAREADENPAAQAAARGIATACMTAYSPTGALGYTFYAAAAAAYDKAGTQEKAAVYDALAAEELERILESLRAVAVLDEKDPVKVNWNC